MVKPLGRFASSIFVFFVMSLCLSITNPNNVVFAADHSGDSSSSWTGALESLSRSSSSWTAVLQEGEVPAAQVLDNFRAQNEHVEAELFSRIRNLENRLIDRLPPQLNHGEYANLVRDNLNQAINIRHYHSALSLEIFDITVLELKANLQDQLFNLLLSEPDDRLIQILGESPFPERAIRREALEYLELKMGAVNLNLENARSRFDKVLVEQVLFLGTGSIYYKSTGIAPIYIQNSYRIFVAKVKCEIQSRLGLNFMSIPALVSGLMVARVVHFPT